MDCNNRPCPAPHPRRGNSTAVSERRNRPAFRPRSCRNHGSRAPDQQSRRHMRPRQPGGGLGLEPDGDDTERTARTNRKGPALGLGQHIAVVFVIIAVAAELPSAMRQRAVLNDEIRRGAGRHLDRKGRRRIVVRNIPIPDRLDEVGNSGGEPDAPRKAVGNDVFAATNGWLRLQLRKPDRLSGYHEKSSMLQQEPESTPPKPRATPHPPLTAHLRIVRGFSSSPLLPLKHFARGSVASSKKPIRACACSSAG